MIYNPEIDIKVGDTLSNDASPAYVVGVTDNFIEVVSRVPLSINELQLLFDGGWEQFNEPRKFESKIDTVYVGIFHNPEPKVF